MKLRRTLLAVATLSTLSPLAAYAVYSSPSAVFHSLEMMREPKEFTAEAHYSGPSYPDRLYLSLWMKGMIQGTTPQTMQMELSGTVDVFDHALNRIRWTGRIVDGMLYVRVNEVVNGEGKINEELQIGTWYSFELLPEDTAGTSKEAMDQLLADLSDIGIDITEEEVRQFIDELIDSLYRMRERSGPEGPVYFIDLQPNFIQNAVHTVSKWSNLLEQRNPNAEFGGLSAENILEELRSELGDIRQAERQIHDMITLDAQIWTDARNTPTRATVHADMNYEDFSLTADASLSESTEPLSLQAPAGAIRLEDLMNTDPSYDEFEWEEWDDYDYEDDEVYQWETDSWEEESLGSDGNNESWGAVDTTNTSCTATPGTPEYVLQMRKGLCEAPARPSRR